MHKSNPNLDDDYHWLGITFLILFAIVAYRNYYLATIETGVCTVLLGLICISYLHHNLRKSR